MKVFLPEGLSLEALKRQHPSRPRNPIIADVCFKGGYIDSWGRGTLKILVSCREAALPEPDMKEQDGGFLVTLFKNKPSQERPAENNLNARQAKAVMHVRELGFINNAIYQQINNVGKTTATQELQQLVDQKVLIQRGIKGRGVDYKLAP